MKKSSGFTLIEILVVTTITLIFLGVGLVQYNANTERFKLKNEGKKLVDVLELAKKKALSA
ncbi:MAG: prepilin-type N-terminal cleavage/methylation domain-containing protein, partial [Patescibacteria group bacterium]